MRSWVWILAGTLLLGAALTAQAPEPGRQRLDAAWWTGPLLAPSAGNLPPGQFLFEPYFYDVVTGPSQYAGSLSYLEYGIKPRFTLGLIPTFGKAVAGPGAAHTRTQIGDVSVTGQVGLTRYHPGRWFPALALNLEETLPTGKYDRLGDRPGDGIGSGAWTTTVSIYSQDYYWLRRRILRTRLNISQSISGVAAVSGVSVYGTPAAFNGRARPGAVSSLDLGLEYSLDRHWVLALDAASRFQSRTLVYGQQHYDQSASAQGIFAPAVEYNFAPNLGVIAGARLIELGHNFTRSVTPVMAINWVR